MKKECTYICIHSVIARNEAISDVIHLKCMKTYYVYIMTNQSNKVLYTGVSSNLEKRVQEHKNNKYPHSFTSRYRCYKLVHYEITNDVKIALSREKQIKAGSRKKKIELVTEHNPEWKDLLFR